MMTNLPKVKHVKNSEQEDPWAKLRARPGVTILSEARLDA